ncbi:hypothetical protein [Mycolicibacterium sphagni]|uniref:hypothetical protein n=1 Tax=Mycolicibacterium sphagni TaxID=1786 RepID=UPI0021F269A5|nr:hypothetical protein [Mycolicibacterium sphagni]MCV7179542.1 hypothetical protein [Mycolicibacterium sphagni]
MTTTTAAQTTKTPTRKAPAKAAPTKPVEKKEAKTYTSEATGRGGRTNVRKTAVLAEYAVDVADKNAKTEAGRTGLIFRFFADETKAQAFADSHNAAGNDAIVVPATSKEA